MEIPVVGTTPEYAEIPVGPIEDAAGEDATQDDGADEG